MAMVERRIDGRRQKTIVCPTRNVETPEPGLPGRIPHTMRTLPPHHTYVATAPAFSVAAIFFPAWISNVCAAVPAFTTISTRLPPGVRNATFGNTSDAVDAIRT